MNKEQKPSQTTKPAIAVEPVLCTVCKSADRVKFLTITDCNLCQKCQDELSDGFELAMMMDRSDYPEL